MSLPPTRGEVCVSLRMRLDDEGRPTGTVWQDGGVPTPFVGWVSLMGELSSLLEASTLEEPREWTQDGEP